MKYDVTKLMKKKKRTLKRMHFVHVIQNNNHNAMRISIIHWESHCKKKLQ